MLRRNVLIFHLGALGDFVLTWPLALALGRLFPQSRVFYVTHAQKGRLAERVLRLESVGIETGWHGLFSEGGGVPLPSLRLLSGAHTIVSFISSPHDLWSDNVRRLAPEANLTALRPTPPEGFTGHASTDLLQQLTSQPTIHTALEQILRSVQQRGLGPTRTLGGDILIHPGSGSREKCWPPCCFAELARRLARAGRRVRILLGEVERERLSPAELAGFAGMALEQPQTLVDLYDALSGGRLLVCNDSGPGHLAGIVGLQVVSLFGPTDPSVWKPLGPQVHVLHHQPLAELTVETVLDQALSLL